MAGVTRRSLRILVTSLLLALVNLLVVPPFSHKTAFAENPPSVLHWSIVNTPSIDGNVIVEACEINGYAFGQAEQAMYAVDISAPGDTPGTYGRLYKSTNKGITWDYIKVTKALIDDGASTPVWNIAVSPDDINFVVAVTDKVGAAVEGPQAVFISTDGGQNWQNTQLNLDPSGDEFVSCLAISPQYDVGKRYVAVATRRISTGAHPAEGRVFTFKAPGFSLWENQSTAPSINWSPGDVVALKFSPSYVLDSTIIVVSASSGGLFLNIGAHDIMANRTTWKNSLGYPVKITASDGRSPTHTQIITADLEIPSDFSGSDPGNFRRYFLSFDAWDGTNYFSGIFRVDNSVGYQLLYNATLLMTTPDQRISSIAYYGTYASGKLIAGATTADPNHGAVDIWLCQDPLTVSPPSGWALSDYLKSPTGGGTTGLCNSLLLWDAQGDKVYCGTSSANLTNGGTSWSATTWPGGMYSLTPPNYDESAFSIGSDNGDIWNQLSLIDTKITRLTDVAAIEAAEDSEDSDEYSVLYLASVNTDINGFDSIWRSVSDPLGVTWERVLCIATAYNDIILRINPRLPEELIRSKVIMFADLNSDNIQYSADEGEHWELLYPNVPVTDFTLASDNAIYVLQDIYVVKATRAAASWSWGVKESTGLTAGHSIATPLKNPKGKRDQFEDWVLVGSASLGEVAFADFSVRPVKFLPSLDDRKILPMPGDAHVLFDEQFEANRTIYAASGDVENGKIYRWIIGKSKEWDELKPPNGDFRGLVQKQDVLYGAFDRIDLPYPGVDRTLYPRATVPPPPDWDDLTADLTADVRFTREPAALKVSEGVDNNLWAIDNREFDPPLMVSQGHLWLYTDTLAKHGPWTTAPASADVIPVDPVTGRANEVNFAWRQLSYAERYELQIAKDADFILRLVVNDNILPINPVSPAYVQFPGILEAGHKYFWRVRASRASTGEIIRSPWSATMYFTGMAGFSVEPKALGPTLLHPQDGCTMNDLTPAFSWSPMFQTTRYQFILARDAALSQIIEDAVVSTTAYEYKDKLQKGTYYWRVMAIEPVVSEASPVGSFTIGAPEKGTPSPQKEKTKTVSPFVWIGISLFTIFVIARLVLIMRTRYRR